MKTKAYFYGRFSTSEQKDGRSFDRQIEKAKAFAKKKNLELDERYFFDEGKSAFVGRHAKDGALAEFIEAVKAGEIAKGSYLLVENQDRLSRERVTTALMRFLELLQQGMVVVTLDGEQEFTSDADFTRLMLALVPMQVAFDESKKKSERLSDVWGKKKRLAREEGKPLGDNGPHWLTYDEKSKSFGANEKSEIVVRIFTLSAQGYGKGKIASALNKDGIPSFKAGTGRRSGIWQQSSIDKILKSRSVLGEYQPYRRVVDFDEGKKLSVPDGEAIKGFYPSIISEELFSQANRALAQRRTSKQTKTGDLFSNLLQGVAKCGVCGSAMHFVNKGERPKGGNYLVCSKAKVGAGCPYHGYKYETLEEILVETLTKLPSLKLVQESVDQLEVAIDVFEGELALGKGKLEKLTNLLMTVPSEALAIGVREQELKIKEMDSELAGLRERLAQGGYIRDKDGFIRGLDLDTYGGRYKANRLLRAMQIRFDLRFLSLSKVESRQLATDFLVGTTGRKKVSRAAVNSELDAMHQEWVEVWRGEDHRLMDYAITRKGWSLKISSVESIKAADTQGEYVVDEHRLIADLSSTIIQELGADIEAVDYRARVQEFLKKLN